MLYKGMVNPAAAPEKIDERCFDELCQWLIKSQIMAR
jgi:hypothetical protein